MTPGGNESGSSTCDHPHPATRHLARLTHLAYRVYTWLVMVPLLVLSTLVAGIAVIILSVLGKPDFASRLFGTGWAKFNTWVSMVSVRVEGEAQLQPGQSYVIVANHQSQFDILVLYGFLGRDIKWVMKQELRQVPVLGAACAAMGHILIDRSDTDAALASINSARHRIRDGMSVVFFPEGTRSRSNELEPFKKGAFRLAQELQLPILPVTILGTRKILPATTLDLHPGEVTMVMHPPIDSQGMDLPTLIQQTRQVMLETLTRQA
jgi:1-acyl-sn-glycerol-3-phosphate acyltransferase